MKLRGSALLEWSGAITAILYSLLVAFNIGVEFYGFALLFLSAILLTIWAINKNFKGITL